MARKRKPVDETPEEAQTRKTLEHVANFFGRSEKTSWNRKMKNMMKLLDNIRPLEDEIIELQAKKIPIFDKIQELRQVMVSECIHPMEYLSLHTSHIECKFCGSKISIPKNAK